MSIYIKLDKSIDSNKLIEKIKKLISSCSPDTILVISTTIPEQTNIDLIPKLEYKKTPDHSGVSLL